MPYKDLKKRREVIRNSMRNIRKTAKLEPFIKNGELDIVAYLQSPEVKLGLAGLIQDALEGKRTNSQFLKFITQLMGIYTEKQEVTQKVEFTVADRQQIYGELLDMLRREAEVTRICPVCGERKILRSEILLPSKSELESPNNREVATVAVPT